jgi:hypothetical protein
MMKKLRNQPYAPKNGSIEEGKEFLPCISLAPSAPGIQQEV